MDRKEGARINLPLPYSFCYDASLVECEKFFFSCMIKALLVVIFDKKKPSTFVPLSFICHV